MFFFLRWEEDEFEVPQNEFSDTMQQEEKTGPLTLKMLILMKHCLLFLSNYQHVNKIAYQTVDVHTTHMP